MKYIIFIGDGMADRTIPELGDKTPLEFADTPNMDEIAYNGKNGLAKTVPEGMGAGTDVAIMSILGYDPRIYYTGRGPLEAAGIGIRLEEDEIAFRCNLITERDGRLIDYSAGQITNEESMILIHTLNERMNARFYHGVGYRHLLVLNGGLGVRCTPPHDVMGKRIEDHLPVGKGNEILRKLIFDSKKILEVHEINKMRREKANMIWPWGGGISPILQPFEEKYGIGGSVISAVDLVKGLGRLVGLRPIDVPGATGNTDTNYIGKAEYAVEALASDDLVLVHVEAPDEASHMGDLDAKLDAIERIDEMLGLIMDAQNGAKILLLPDHFTPLSLRTHSSEPVPFTISSTRGDDVTSFNEKSAKKGSFGTIDGDKLMNILISDVR
jgi:2,3-bisphosphoglycerate-independent phosphoglycerate mutase